MEETEFLRDGTTVVTSTQVVINGQTFAVRNIGSVKVTQPGTPWIAIILLVLFGVSIFTAGDQGTARAMAIIFTAACGAWVYNKVRTRRLVLVSGGGEVVALTSKDAAAVERLRAAIAKAIAVR